MPPKFTLEQNLKNKSESSSAILEKIEIYTPTNIDLESQDFEFLHTKLQENHKKILPQITAGNYPFFGLHGTNTEKVNSILQSENAHLELATFYEKENNDYFLYKLYAMAGYTASYAIKDKENLQDDRKKEGSILVVNLEKAGKNITFKWEHLKSASSGMFILGADNDNEKMYRDSINDQSENRLFRTDGNFDIKKRFTENLVYEIKFSEFPDLIRPFKRGTEDIGYKIIQDRFRDQEIIKRALNFLNGYK